MILKCTGNITVFIGQIEFYKRQIQRKCSHHHFLLENFHQYKANCEYDGKGHHKTFRNFQNRVQISGCGYHFLVSHNFASLIN